MRNMLFSSLLRRTVFLGLLLLAPFAFLTPASAATPGEAFVSQNVQKGLSILNNKSLSKDQKRLQFQDFLLNLTDVNRIANFTLGRARQSASPADQAGFANAFKNYALAVYQSRLSSYAGQTLKVIGSIERATDDYVVNTVLIDPTDTNHPPLKVDFRVLKDGARFVVIDFSVEGIWIAIEQRDQFASFLSQNNNSIPALIKHLNDLAGDLRKNP